VRKTFALAVLSLVVLALSLSAFAAGKDGVVLSKDGKMTIATERSKVSKPYTDVKNNLTKDYNNLGSAYPDGVYWCCTGATISGPNSIIGAEYWAAEGFTANTSTIKNVKVAVGYVTGNTTDVIVSLNADNGGVPGAALKHWKSTVTSNAFGSCCGVEAHGINVSVTPGTQYWIVVSTEADSDIWAAWNVNDTLQLFSDAIPTASYQSGTWYGYSGYPGFAFEVQGQ
jgi:hypothetical protein